MYTALLALLPLIAATPISKRATNQHIFSGRDGRCLTPDVPLNAKSSITSGTPVVSKDCSQAFAWDINYGSGSVFVSGTNFALDAGSTPGNNGALKVWQSYPGIFQQTWYLTLDNRIAITGGDQCLDEGNNGIQTYRCTPNNGNQVFFLDDQTPHGGPGDYGGGNGNPGGNNGDPVPPSEPSNQYPDVPVGTIYGDVQFEGQRLHPFTRDDLCLAVIGDNLAVGAQVGLAYNIEQTSPFARAIVWDLPAIGSTGQVRLHGTDFCLDAGINPSNGVSAKIWTCGNFPQQQWTRENSRLITANNQCLDVKKESGPQGQKVVRSLKDVQTWECSGPLPQNNDPYQIFYTR